VSSIPFFCFCKKKKKIDFSKLEGFTYKRTVLRHSGPPLKWVKTKRDFPRTDKHVKKTESTKPTRMKFLSKLRIN
jgi:hypothetical protein